MAKLRSEDLKVVLDAEKNIDLVKPSFLFFEDRLSATRVRILFNPPVNHAAIVARVVLDIEAPEGYINCSQFQLRDRWGEKQKHPTGGIVISIGELQHKVIYASYEFPLDVLGGFKGIASEQYLLKSDPTDQRVLVKPYLPEHGRKPYVLQNSYGGTGLRVGGYKLIEISSNGTGGDILIKRM